MSLNTWIFLIVIASPSLGHGIKNPADDFDIKDYCEPVCSGDPIRLGYLLDELRDLDNQTIAPCGPQAVMLAAAEMCKTPERLQRPYSVWPMYALLDVEWFHLGMPPAMVSDALNLVFSDYGQICPASGGTWKPLTAEGSYRPPTKDEYIKTLGRLSKGDGRVAAALVQAKNVKGKKLAPHWMVVYGVDNVLFAGERTPQCVVKARDIRGVGSIPCESFYEQAARVGEYPFYATSFGIVWFDRRG